MSYLCCVRHIFYISGPCRHLAADTHRSRLAIGLNLSPAALAIAAAMSHADNPQEPPNPSEADTEKHTGPLKEKAAKDTRNSMKLQSGLVDDWLKEVVRPTKSCKRVLVMVGPSTTGKTEYSRALFQEGLSWSPSAGSSTLLE